ncbi:MAG: Ig-like domain-containing protein [Actinomycetota bacterium]|nr:Ig-like domain-containing protein [Actinomycetota bacterium]
MRQYRPGGARLSGFGPCGVGLFGFGRRVATCLVSIVLMIAATPGIAYAYWVSADTTHSAKATAEVLPAGLQPASVTASGRAVTVLFNRVSSSAASGSLLLTSYRIYRYPADAPTGAQPAGSLGCGPTDGLLAGCTDTEVPDGLWVYTDAPTLGNWLGAESARSTSIAVDGSAPVLSITAPAIATNDSTPTVSGLAGTASGDQPAITVRIYAGVTVTGSPLQSRTVTAVNGAWSFVASPLAGNASYTVQASQRDAAGNLGVASSTFVLDTIAPSISLNTPASVLGATPSFSGGAGTVVASTTTSADSAYVSVRIFAGSVVSGNPVQTLTGPRSGASWAASSPGLASGKYTAQASLSDAAGNVSYSSPKTFTVDASAPAVSVTSPVDGGATASLTPTVTGFAGTASGDLSTIAVSVYAGATATGTPLQSANRTASAGSWNLTLAALAPNRQYAVRASQADSYGNIGIASSTFVLDTLAPQVSLAGLPGLTSATPTFTGTAGTVAASATSSADAGTVTVRVYAGSSTGGNLIRTLTANVAGGNYTVPAGALGTGTYTAQASQADGAGNVSLSAASTFTVDGSAPAVSLQSIPAYGTDSTPSFSGTAGTAPGDQAGVSVAIYAGGSATGTPLQVVSSTRTGGSWTVLVFSALPANAQYTVQASQLDAAGNLGLSVARSFTIDTQGPANLAITSPGSGETGLGSRPSITGTAGTASESATTGADDSTVTVRIYRAGGGLDQTLVPAVGAGGAWSVRISNGNRLTAGQSYTVVVSQRDELGNTSTSAPIGFTA